MNQIKIGKFIAECRKNKKLTQMELAEKLNITDRAVSKWENGKAMPDSSIMLDLCNELGISVNELLSGEMIEMENYDKKTEELLLEMARKEESNNKKLMTAMYVIVIFSVVFLVSILELAAYFVTDNTIKIIMCVGATVISFALLFYALKLEVAAGYYECKNCHHKFTATYSQAIWASHMGTTRHLRCPKCNKKSWCKKVLSK